MALSLTKTGITTGNTVEAFHVTQSIDAFTGTEAYNIILSGSLQVTGSVAVQGLTNPTQNDVLTYDTTTGQIFYTASSTLTDTSSFVTNAQTGSFVTTSSYSTSTGSFYVSSSVVSNVITFHLGNGTTQTQTIDTGSGGGGGGGTVSTTGSVITASHTPINSYPEAVPGNVQFTKGDGSTFNVTTGKTWITASSTLNNIPPGNYGIYINYNGSAQVTLDITGSNIGDEIEIITDQSATGKIVVDYDTGQIFAWDEQTNSGGHLETAAGSQHPTMKLVYLKIGEWYLVRYMDATMYSDSGQSIKDATNLT